MPRYLVALLFCTFALIKGNEIEASSEVSLDEPQPQDSFLSLNDEASSFSLDLFNVTDLFNASAIVNSVQEMMDPIGQRIDSVGQQIDAAFAWIGDGIQDTVQEVVKSIHDPINEQLDAVWSLIGGEPVNLENGKMTVVNEEGKIVSVVPNTNSDENIEVTITTEKNTQDNNHEEIQIIMFQEEVVNTLTPPAPVPVPVPEPVRIETPVRVPIEDIDEIVVLVDYNDIAAAMNSPNTTAESIEKEPFYVRFFEVFMGKEVELEVKSANLTPVEDSKKKRQIISYDAL